MKFNINLKKRKIADNINSNVCTYMTSDRLKFSYLSQKSYHLAHISHRIGDNFLFLIEVQKMVRL